MNNFYNRQEPIFLNNTKINRTSVSKFYNPPHENTQRLYTSHKNSGFPDINNLNKIQTKIKKSQLAKFQSKLNTKQQENVIVTKQKIDYSLVKSKVNTNINPQNKTNNSIYTLRRDSTQNKFNHIELDKPREQQESDEETFRRLDENEIKKLNNWEFHHLLNKDNNYINENTKINKPYKKELEKINWINELKEDLQKLHFDKEENGDMGIFFRKEEEEHQSLYLQNVYLAKKQFNFDVFRNKNVKINLNGNSENKVSFNKNETGSEILSLDAVKHENYDRISNVNFYRGIIKEKIKIELNFRKDIIELSSLYYDKKYEKNKIKKEKYKLIFEYNQIKIEFKQKEESLEKDIKDVQTIYTQRNNSITAEYLKKSVNSPNEKDSFNLQSDFFKFFNKKNLELDTLTAEYEKKLNNFDSKINQINKSLEYLDQELQFIKNNINDMIKDQRQYYLEILKKGIDVRSEGLTWVVKRLIEFDSFFENSMFPRFLENSHIEYLLKYSYKTIENNILKLILKGLKEKQKRVRNQTQKILITSPMNIKTPNSDEFYLFPRDSKTSYLNFLSEGDIYALKNFYQQQQEKLSSTYEKKLEELQINHIIEEYKKEIHKTKPSKRHELEKENDEGILNKYFKNNEKQREFFEEIILLRDIIRKNEEEAESLKKEEVEKFRKKYENYKASKNGNVIQLIYAALFGNGIHL